MFDKLNHIRSRRAELRNHIDVVTSFKQWEETCVPSYCHDNPAAAYVSWLRLFAAADLARTNVTPMARVLDFGASVGELGNILGDNVEYHFIEQEEFAVQFLADQLPRAHQQQLESAPQGSYDAVFAIDSLEHNENYAELIGKLKSLLRPGGIFVLSGPTENFLYRLGRKIAGFDGEYHVTTIFDIERAASEVLERVDLTTVPFGVPLFRISAWRRD